MKRERRSKSRLSGNGFNLEEDVEEGLPKVLEVERVAGHGQVKEHDGGVGDVIITSAKCFP